MLRKCLESSNPGVCLNSCCVGSFEMTSSGVVFHTEQEAGPASTAQVTIELKGLLLIFPNCTLSSSLHVISCVCSFLASFFPGAFTASEPNVERWRETRRSRQVTRVLCCSFDRCLQLFEIA